MWGSKREEAPEPIEEFEGGEDLETGCELGGVSDETHSQRDYSETSGYWYDPFDPKYSVGDNLGTVTAWYDPFDLNYGQDQW
jgi:hypothetical protein